MIGDTKFSFAKIIMKKSERKHFYYIFHGMDLVFLVFFVISLNPIFAWIQSNLNGGLSPTGAPRSRFSDSVPRRPALCSSFPHSLQVSPQFEQSWLISWRKTGFFLVGGLFSEGKILSSIKCYQRKKKCCLKKSTNLPKIVAGHKIDSHNSWLIGAIQRKRKRPQTFEDI